MSRPVAAVVVVIALTLVGACGRGQRAADPAPFPTLAVTVPGTVAVPATVPATAPATAPATVPPTAPPTVPVDTVASNATVEFVVDGDTVDIVVDGVEERVRLIGIDTPEIAHDASATRPASAAECFGEEAKVYTASLLPVGTPVRLERDVVPRDDYGRLLAYVYRAADGVLVNYEIIRHGYAQPLTIPPNVQFSDVMVEAARQAERDDAGLWSACGA